MIVGNIYILQPNQIPQKNSFQEVIDVCEETEPKPLYCELPDELKLSSKFTYGTVQTHTLTTPSSPASGYGTSTTTTL